MRTMQRVGAILIAGGLLMMLTAPAAAQNTDQVCQGLDSGKIDTSGDPGSVTITAPEGFLIDGYCVKAGSAKQGNGPEYVTLDPPVASITITHSSGKAVSHYSYSLTEVPTTTTTTLPPTTTTTVPPTTTTTVPPTTTTTVPPTTTTTQPPVTTTTLPPVTTTTQPPVTTTTVPTTTTTVPTECGPDSDLWNEATQTCELPFTGPGDVLAALAVIGALLTAGGLGLLALARRQEAGLV